MARLMKVNDRIDRIPAPQKPAVKLIKNNKIVTPKHNGDAP
jgi:hypothetical protein